MKQPNNQSYATLVRITEQELATMMPQVRDRIIRRLCTIYWLGVADGMEAVSEHRSLEPSRSD